MRAAIVRTRIDRKTREVLSKEIVGYKEVDEEEYYRPIVESTYNEMKEKGLLK